MSSLSRHLKKLCLYFQAVELEMCELDFLMTDNRLLVFLTFDLLDSWPET